MASQVMRITLKAYDHQLVDASAQKIIETVKKNGAKVRRTGAASDQKGSSNQFFVPYTNTKIPVSSSSREHTRD